MVEWQSASFCLWLDLGQLLGRWSPCYLDRILVSVCWIQIVGECGRLLWVEPVVPFWNLANHVIGNLAIDVIVLVEMRLILGTDSSQERQSHASGLGRGMV